MKAIEMNLAGKKHYLIFNGEAMFAIKDEFGGAKALLEEIEPNTREAFRAICKAIAILAEQGELVRRDLGYSPERIYTAEEFQRLALPEDIINMKKAIPLAITIGFGREVESENEEVDLALAELEQKKTT